MRSRRGGKRAKLLSHIAPPEASCRRCIDWKKSLCSQQNVKEQAIKKTRLSRPSLKSSLKSSVACEQKKMAKYRDSLFELLFVNKYEQLRTTTPLKREPLDCSNSHFGDALIEWVIRAGVGVSP